MKTMVAGFSEPGVPGKADCFDACVSTLTQDKRMSDVLWFVVWARELLKAELCIKSEFNSLCAERFSLPLTTLVHRHTRPPCFSLAECVMKAREVKFWFR